MRLRTELYISYLILLFLVMGGGVLLSELTLTGISGRYLELAMDGVDRVTQANFGLAQKILTSYGERLVEMKARSAAQELSVILDGTETYDYQAMRHVYKLRELATQPIRGADGVAGSLDLLDNTGVAVLHPNPEVEGRNYSQWKDKYPRMWALVEESFTKPEVKGYYTFIDEAGRERQRFLVMVQIRGTPFILCAAVNIDQFFLPVQERIRRQGREITGQSERRMASAGLAALQRTRLILGGAALAALLLALVLALYMAHILTRPLAKLQEGVEEMGRGRLDIQVREEGGRETAALARDFNRMGRSLRDYMDRVARESAARQAVESEIRIARQIQESLLPQSFPPFPDRRDFDLYAANLPAKEVAGDFYDFFLLEDGRLAVIIADVSGKGVPAALFMAVTRTVLRNVCGRASDPAQALTEANRMLARDNEAQMFVTLFLAYYDPDEGTLVYADAGHNPPCIVGPGGGVREFGALGDVALGIMDEYAYATGRERLMPGETLVLYTDGITEAMDTGENLWGEERFHRCLAGLAGREVEDLCLEVLDEVERYQGQVRHDDITILALARTF